MADGDGDSWGRDIFGDRGDVITVILIEGLMRGCGVGTTKNF
jgi:hypothetical protein